MAREAVAAALAVRGLQEDGVVMAGPVRDGHITAADRSGTDRIVSGPARDGQLVRGDGRPRPLPVDQPLW
ncbi:hypothetical protein ACFV5N_11760 [Streptomyces sp. NPDC059853]|uniref:hypothetical protein n=1 Tax=Streptomyces sp. NPDC059853 TaxID=3346973 RepID=UPI00366A4450